jgi:hypothetical protein
MNREEAWNETVNKTSTVTTTCCHSGYRLLHEEIDAMQWHEMGLGCNLILSASRCEITKPSLSILSALRSKEAISLITALYFSGIIILRDDMRIRSSPFVLCTKHNVYSETGHVSGHT